jgi:hypothetical protein
MEYRNAYILWHQWVPQVTSHKHTNTHCCITQKGTDYNLVSHDANVNTNAKAGKMAMQNAVNGGHFEVVSLLSNRGRDVVLEHNNYY